MQNAKLAGLPVQHAGDVRAPPLSTDNTNLQHVQAVTTPHGATKLENSHHQSPITNQSDNDDETVAAKLCDMQFIYKPLPSITNTPQLANMLAHTQTTHTHTHILQNHNHTNKDQAQQNTFMPVLRNHNQP